MAIEVLIYTKRNQISLWKKQGNLWFRFKVKTPKFYADMEAKLLKRKPNYGPCWWGQGETSPDKLGYKYLGTVHELP